MRSSISGLTISLQLILLVSKGAGFWGTAAGQMQAEVEASTLKQAVANQGLSRLGSAIVRCIKQAMLGTCVPHGLQRKQWRSQQEGFLFPAKSSFTNPLVVGDQARYVHAERWCSPASLTAF